MPLGKGPFRAPGCLAQCTMSAKLAETAPAHCVHPRQDTTRGDSVASCARIYDTDSLELPPSENSTNQGWKVGLTMCTMLPVHSRLHAGAFAQLSREGELRETG